MFAHPLTSFRSHLEASNSHIENIIKADASYQKSKNPVFFVVLFGVFRIDDSYRFGVRPIHWGILSLRDGVGPGWDKQKQAPA